VALLRNTLIARRLVPQLILRRRVADESEPAYVFTTDGPASVKVPLSAADWTALSLPTPQNQWNCQDASGALAAAIGSVTLAATGASVAYQQTVVGWTRRFVGFTAEVANQRFSTTDASLDAAAGESVAWLIYAAVQAGSATPRGVLQASAAPVNNIRVSTTLYQHAHNNTTTNSATAPLLTTVKAMIWYRNATTNVSGLILPGDHTTGTHEEGAFTATTTKGLGCNGLTSSIARFGLACHWKGANAETIAQVATLTTLGWS
jgi:hypothetical protein